MSPTILDNILHSILYDLHSTWDSILHRILSTPHRESGAVQSSSVACPAAHPHRQPPTGLGQTLHPASGL